MDSVVKESLQSRLSSDVPALCTFPGDLAFISSLQGTAELKVQQKLQLVPTRRQRRSMEKVSISG